MNTQQQAQVAKHIREYVYVDASGKMIPICKQEIPSSQPIPKVGDQISIPQSLEGRLGTSSTVFKIIQRRFPLVIDGLSVSVVVFFVSDVKE